MIICHDVERIWRTLGTPNFSITVMIMNKYYPGETVNIHIQSLVIHKKNQKGRQKDTNVDSNTLAFPYYIGS